MQTVDTPNAPAAIGPYSQGIAVNGLVFFSGQIALTTKGNFVNDSVEAETNQIFKNIEALLVDQGITKKQVVKCTVFLTSMNDFTMVNEMYANFFGDHKPARSCVAVSELPRNAKVEIELIAIL